MDISKALKSTPKSVLIGVGVALAAPLVWPILAAAARPVAKAAIKTYLGVADTIKEAVAETGEKMSDLVAEAKAERAGIVSEETAEPFKTGSVG